MKVIGITIALCFTYFLPYAQQKSIQVNTQISTLGYEFSKQQLQNWLAEHNYHIISQNDNDQQLGLVMHLSEAQFNEWKSWSLSLGNLEYQNVETMDTS